MKVGIIGRTKILLDTAKLLSENGFDICFLYTCKSEPFYQCNPSDFQKLANDLGIDFFNDLEINTNERVQLISSYNCDIGISMNWLTVLKAPICHAFKHGIWNAHAGDLPRYRGNACPNWAIINNEETIGLSIHEMVPDELDSGDIILKSSFSLTDNTYIGHIYEWLHETIPPLFLKASQKLQAGTLQKMKQSLDPKNALRCYPRKPEDGRIVWSHPVKKVHALVRASSHPFSGAFCFTENRQRIIVWEADPFYHACAFCAVPGQVLIRDRDDPVIACADGALMIKKASTEDGVDAKPLILTSLRNRLT